LAAAKTRGLRPKLGWNVIDEVNCPNSQIMYIYIDTERERTKKCLQREGDSWIHPGFLEVPRILLE